MRAGFAYGPKVVTYQSGSGAKFSVCWPCEFKLRYSQGTWPKDANGREFSTVAHGAHRAPCQAEGHGG